MGNFIEKVFGLLAYFIIIIFVGCLLIFIYQNHLSYEYFTSILKIIIWPAIVLVALLFFRKVFVYMFFSMEEFNFFGARGVLKDIRKVIEEKVQERIQQEKNQEERNKEINKFTEDLKEANKLKGNAEKKASEISDIATDIFSKYKELSKQNTAMLNELNEFRRQKEERELRFATMRERIKRRRNENVHEMEDAAVDTPKADKPKNEGY